MRKRLGRIRDGDPQPAGLDQCAGVVHIGKTLGNRHLTFQRAEHVAEANLAQGTVRLALAADDRVCGELAETG